MVAASRRKGMALDAKWSGSRRRNVGLTLRHGALIGRPRGYVDIAWQYSRACERVASAYRYGAWLSSATGGGALALFLAWLVIRHGR